MTPALTDRQFRAACKRLVGVERGWRAIIGRLLDVNHFTITRYADGRLVVPKRIHWALYGLDMCKKHEPKMWERLVA